MTSHKHPLLPCLILMCVASPFRLRVRGEVIHESGACYTSGVCGFHQLQCGLRERIAVHRAYYGFKPAPLPATPPPPPHTMTRLEDFISQAEVNLSDNNSSEGNAVSNREYYVFQTLRCPGELGPNACEQIDTYRCCHLAEPRDCVLPYQPHHLSHVLHACAGRSACSVQAARSRGLCSDDTRHLSTFSTIQYSCVQESAVAKFCSDNIVWGSQVSAVLEASQWPEAELMQGTVCTCAVDTVSGEATSVKLVAMDYRTGGQGSDTCTPINVTSPRGQSQVPCDNQNAALAELGMTVTPARLQLTVGATLPPRIWIGFDGAQGSLILRCRQSGIGNSNEGLSPSGLDSVAPGLVNGGLLQRPSDPSPATVGSTSGSALARDTSTAGQTETTTGRPANSDTSGEKPSHLDSPRPHQAPLEKSTLSATSQPTSSSSTASSNTARQGQTPDPPGGRSLFHSSGEMSLGEWFREKEFHWTPNPEVSSSGNVGQSMTEEKNTEMISTLSTTTTKTQKGEEAQTASDGSSSINSPDRKLTENSSTNNSEKTTTIVPLTKQSTEDPPAAVLDSADKEFTVGSKVSAESSESLPDMPDSGVKGSASKPTRPLPSQTTTPPSVPTSTATLSNDHDVVYLIAGSVVGCVVVLVLLIVIAACLIRRCRKTPDSQNKRRVPDLGYQFVDMKAAEHMRAKVNLAFDLYQAQHDGRDLAPYTELPVSQTAFRSPTSGTFSQRQVSSSGHYSVARIPDWEPDLAPEDSDSSDATCYDRLGQPHPHPAPRPRAPSCYSQLGLLEEARDLRTFPTSPRTSSTGSRQSGSSGQEGQRSDSGEEGVYAVIMADEELQANIELGTTPC